MATPASLRRPKTRKQRLHRGPQPLSVAFVCYGNACRSQMAEAWARHYRAGRVVAQSAGVHPLGEVTWETQVVMAEKGVSLEGHYSKGLDAIDWKRVDAVVNMTPYPTGALVPGFSGRRVTWKVADPFLEPVDFYRSIRDEVERRVRALIEELRGSQSRVAEIL
ncbi:MAG: low molecular weight phosphatase family protein [Terriglobia bacterium]